MPFGDLPTPGYWNASTNEIQGSPRIAGKGIPLLPGRCPTPQLFYVAVAGNTPLDNISAWYVGDWAVNFGFGWGKFCGPNSPQSGGGFSGNYNDLTNKPSLFSGLYADLQNKPSLFSGAYSDLTGRPNLFSGAYADLTDKPALFSGAYSDLSGRPNLGGAALLNVGTGANQVAAGNDSRFPTSPLGDSAYLSTTGLAASPAFQNQTLPRYYAALYGVVAGAAQPDQSANLQAAFNAMPANGCILVLPAGKIRLSSTVTCSQTRVQIEGAGLEGTILMTSLAFAAGDVLRISGLFSSIRNVGFRHETNTDGSFAYRTAGYALSMTGGYQHGERISIQCNFRGILLQCAVGYSALTDIDITFITSTDKAAGSGGIVVTKATFGGGPANFISRCLIYGDGGATDTTRPAFGIQVLNSGETNIFHADILGCVTNLLVNPSTATINGVTGGYTSQALTCMSCVFDSSKGDNVVIKPSGLGWVFDSKFIGCWITNTGSSGTHGLVVTGLDAQDPTNGGNYGGALAPVMNTKWIGGFIVNTVGPANAGYGVLINGRARDTLISGTSIAGWQFGVDIAPTANHAKIVDNYIGRCSPFGGQERNIWGICLEAGGADYIDISNNTLFGNTSGPILDQNPGGTHIQYLGNLGFNETQPPGGVTLTASPMDIRNTGQPAMYLIQGGSGVSVSYMGTVIMSVTPNSFIIPPRQLFTLTYSSAPTVTRVPY